MCSAAHARAQPGHNPGIAREGAYSVTACGIPLAKRRFELLGISYARTQKVVQKAGPPSTLGFPVRSKPWSMQTLSPPNHLNQNRIVLLEAYFLQTK
jgi:hypothetical protein